MQWFKVCSITCERKWSSCINSEDRIDKKKTYTDFKKKGGFSFKIMLRRRCVDLSRSSDSVKQFPTTHKN